MSWDLAVWEGEQPASSEEAAEHFQELMEAYEEQLDNEPCDPPNPRLGAFLDALVERLPDDPAVEPPSNPWAFMPLREEASGPIAMLHVVWSQVDVVLSVVPALAREHGLVCFDLQEEAVLSGKLF